MQAHLHGDRYSCLPASPSFLPTSLMVVGCSLSWSLRLSTALWLTLAGEMCNSSGKPSEGSWLGTCSSLCRNETSSSLGH